MSEADSYTIEGVSRAGRELLYAGPSSEMAMEVMANTAKKGRFERFEFKWWECGDYDGVDYSSDGKPLL